MSLPLTRDNLRAAYNYLAETAPYCRWNMPDGEDVEFRVVRSLDLRGWYQFRDGRHFIGISSGCIGRTASLMEVMAHEMLHMHQRLSGMESPHAQHNAAFNKLAARVCDVHGFDPKLF